jgi:aspartate aminotransferase-like enzyme
MDEYGVDVSVLSTQKGLRLDAGMCFVILNERSLEHSKRVTKINYYDNFSDYLDDYNLGKGHVPFTPAVRMVFELNQRLRNLEVEKEIETAAERAGFFREQIKQLPFKIVPETPSNFLTALLITGKYDVKGLYEFLRSRNIFIIPTGKQLDSYLKNASQTYFRVAHIGCGIPEHEKLIAEMRRFFK